MLVTARRLQLAVSKGIARGGRVRLIGFDAPEPSWRWAKCGVVVEAGRRASRILRALVRDQSVRLEFSGQRDRYGRPLAQLIVDGRDVAEIAIEAGWGKAWGGITPKPA